MAAATTKPPPVATTPMKANCEAPVNISSDSAWAWPTFSPAAMLTAPKEMA